MGGIALHTGPDYELTQIRKPAPDIPPCGSLIARIHAYSVLRAANLCDEADMGRRHYKRLHIALPVTISGLDSNANRFTQSATTADIGVNGMRLRGVRCLHAPGELVQVEYQGRHARYRVAWIGAIGTCWEGLVGLQGLEGARFLFSDHLPAAAYSLAGAEPDTYAAETAAPPAVCPGHAAIERREQERREQERRRHPRYNCAGIAKLWENGSEHSIAGRVNEISRGGCYVEIMSPMRTGTAMRLELSVSGRTIHLEGIVRTSQPTCGMGVEFTRMAPADAERLCHVVSELAGEAPEPSPEPAAAPERSTAASPERVGEAVIRWFGLHETLTREEFLQLMEPSARAELARS
jgi:PilZ domain-containing protein